MSISLWWEERLFLFTFSPISSNQIFLSLWLNTFHWFASLKSIASSITAAIFANYVTIGKLFNNDLVDEFGVIIVATVLRLATLRGNTFSELASASYLRRIDWLVFLSHNFNGISKVDRLFWSIGTLGLVEWNVPFLFHLLEMDGLKAWRSSQALVLHFSDVHHARFIKRHHVDFLLETSPCPSSFWAEITLLAHRQIFVTASLGCVFVRHATDLTITPHRAAFLLSFALLNLKLNTISALFGQE